MNFTEAQIRALLTLENTPRTLKTEWKPGARKLEEAGLLSNLDEIYFPTAEGSEVAEDVFDTVLGAWLKSTEKKKFTTHYYFDGDHQSCCIWRRPRAEPPELELSGKQCVKCIAAIAKEYLVRIQVRES